MRTIAFVAALSLQTLAFPTHLVAEKSGGTEALEKKGSKPAASDETKGLSADEVMTVIRANLNQIRGCYETALEQKPKLKGKLLVEFVIVTTGRVRSVTIKKDGLGDKNLKTCVKNKITNWKFPPPRGEDPVTINYPFAFDPS